MLYISSTSLAYNWKFAPFDIVHPIAPPPPPSSSKKKSDLFFYDFIFEK